MPQNYPKKWRFLPQKHPKISLKMPYFTPIFALFLYTMFYTICKCQNQTGGVGFFFCRPYCPGGIFFVRGGLSIGGYISATNKKGSHNLQLPCLFDTENYFLSSDLTESYTLLICSHS